MGLNVTTVL